MTAGTALLILGCTCYSAPYYSDVVGVKSSFNCSSEWCGERWCVVGGRNGFSNIHLRFLAGEKIVLFATIILMWSALCIRRFPLRNKTWTVAMQAIHWTGTSAENVYAIHARVHASPASLHSAHPFPPSYTVYTPPPTCLQSPSSL